MNKNINMMDEILKGNIVYSNENELDDIACDWVEYWHSVSEAEDPREIWEVLGISWDEYSVWATAPSKLPQMIQNRKKSAGVAQR